MSQLTPLPMQPPPGLVLTESQRMTAGRWVLPWNWYRFMKGLPQKMGGWVKAFASPTSGIPHAIFAWTDQQINRFLAAGTYRKLYVYDQNGLQNDITPFRLTGTLTNPFTTTNLSSIISVAHTGHGLSIGDTVIYTAVGSAVGGITAAQLIGTFTVLSIVDSADYTFDCGVSASSGATGGGTVSYEYEITTGNEQSTPGLGWGVGGWGLLTWGSPRTSSTIVFEGRVWTLDKFGKILLATYNGGTVYSFDPTVSQPWPRAAVISGAPTDARSMVVTPERFVIVLREAMVLQSSSQADFTVWTPAVNNTAWSRTLTEGSKLMAARVLAPFITLVWSDGALYLLQYTGSQFIYNSSLVGKDCGTVGPQSACTANGVGYWVTPNNLLMYNGVIAPMPNVESVRKYFFDNLTINQTLDIACFYHPTFNEVWIEAAMFGSQTPNYVLIFHINDGAWTFHPLTRASGTHYVNGDTRPYMGDVNGFIYQHEIGNDADGVAITSQITMGPYAMDEGIQSMDCEGIVWDNFQQVGPVQTTVNGYDRLTDMSPMDTDTETVVDSTGGSAGITDYRVSGRYLGWTAIQNTLGAYMRLGKPTAFVKRTAKRR